jgi:hypothetical protein
MSGPTLDLSQMQFPSDKATLADLRKLYPEDFENFGPPKHGGDYIERVLDLNKGNFASMFDWERMYADWVFRNALGIPCRVGGMVPNEGMLEDAADTLTGEYVRIGWAAGEYQAEELVRRIQRQALAQAQKFLGPNGP